MGIRSPHWSVILHEMFLHATKWGQKEAERFVHWGHQGSLPRPDLEADQSVMKLVGYGTSHKQIWDLYHTVYLLRRSPGPPHCGPQQRREAIHDILSSLRNRLHWQVYPIAAKEYTRGPVDEPQSTPRRRGDSHEEALWEARMACQRVLEAAQVLKHDIERLSWGMRDVQETHPHSCSRSHPQSHSLDRWLRSPSRPWQERRLTFQEPDRARPWGLPEAGKYTSPRGVFGLPKCREQGQLLFGAFYKGHWNLVGLVGPPIGYALLVDETHHHSRGRRPKETCSKNLGFLFDTRG